jgi:NAD(P)-dependent dehydrogenase (short-subunit alcohol dehydrogenase family)
MSTVQNGAARAKVAIVTGGSRGLGRNTVAALAENGVNSIFTYHSNTAEAEKAVAEIDAAGAKGIAIQLDTGKPTTFDAFVDHVREALAALGAQKFDYLVNNAGHGVYGSIAETTEAQLDDLYNVHFKGVYLLTQKLLPLMNDGGRIVNVSSGLARFSFPGYSAYASMKGAIEVLTRYMAKELGARGIAVNSVAPGAIETDFGGAAVRNNPQLKEQIANLTALGRTGVADDIGPMIAALLSDANRWVNAQRIEASGGMLI